MEFYRKIEGILPQKYQKYITIVAPNAFSRFSKRDLKNLDFYLILKPFWSIFEASWRPRETILDVLRPTLVNIEPSWSLLEPTWGQHEATWPNMIPTWANLNQNGANLNQHNANLSQHKPIKPQKKTCLSKEREARKCFWVI